MKNNAENKDKWIENLVEGLTFVDAGGLWGIKNEKLTLAKNSGAKEVTIIDSQPSNHEDWNKLQEHLKQNGINEYKIFSCNLLAPNLLEKVGKFDFVHCSGVVYHVPSPISLLVNLRSITNKYLVLTSMVVPEVIRNSRGTIYFQDSSLKFVYLLSEAEKYVLAQHFAENKIPNPSAISAKSPETWFYSVNGENVPNPAPWWTLMTRYNLATLVSAAGFEILDQVTGWEGKSFSMLLKVS